MLGRNYVTDLWWGQSVENIAPAKAAVQHIRQQGLPPSCYCLTSSVEGNRQFGVVQEERPHIKPGVPSAAAYFVSNFAMLNPNNKRFMILLKVGTSIYFLATDEEGTIYPDSDKLFLKDQDLYEALQSFWEIYIAPAPDLWVCKYTADLKEHIFRVIGEGYSEDLFEELPSAMSLFTMAPKDVLRSPIKGWQKAVPSMSYLAAGVVCLWSAYNTSFTYWAQVEARYEEENRIFRERANKQREAREAELREQREAQAREITRARLLEQAQVFVDKGPWPDAIPIEDAAPLCLRLVEKAPVDIPLWDIKEVNCDLENKVLRITYTLSPTISIEEEALKGDAAERLAGPGLFLEDFFARPRILGENQWIEEPFVSVAGGQGTVSYPLKLESLLAKPELTTTEMSLLHSRGESMSEALGLLGLGSLSVGPVTAWAPPQGFEGVVDVIKELGHNYQYFTFTIVDTNYLEELLLLEKDTAPAGQEQVTAQQRNLLLQQVVFESALLNYVAFNVNTGVWRAGGLVYAQR